MSQTMQVTRQPIAVIGAGCRFPGAHGVEQFWRLLNDRGDATRDVPPDRFDIETFYSKEPASPGKIGSRRGGFLERVDEFDAGFFDVKSREAVRMDPQQRLLMMTAWEALEDAGVSLESVAGSRAGVFVGLMLSNYWDLQRRNGLADLDLYSFTGSNQRSFVAGRLSFAFDLRGPSVAVDTACSSSLVAVHMACQSLRIGESTMALAAGVNLVLAPTEGVMYSQVRVLAPDGRCKFGDESADGFVRSDGVGVVVLKPLAQALTDGDRVRAVILGSAVSNDGRTGGKIAHPSIDGQELVLRLAYEDAGVSPADVDYIEAHGTGTPRIDPVELAAFGTVLAPGRPLERPCLVGSVKTNIGHSEGAAGIAGLIKTVLCLDHGEVPPSLHFHRPNPKIPWDNLPIVVPTQTQTLHDRGRPAIAGVCGQGISGTNVHVVLAQKDPNWFGVRAPARTDRPHLLTLSARTPAALDDLVRAYAAFLEPGGTGRDFELRDICYTASARRTHHEYRLAVVGSSHDGLAEQLRAYLARNPATKVAVGHALTNGQRPRIAFVFPGHVEGWHGMGKRLRNTSPVFRAALEACDLAIRKEADCSIIEHLDHHSDSDSMPTEVIPMTLWAMEVALAAVWRSWGVEPNLVFGHGSGEIAACQVAGALTEEDAATVVYRSRHLLAPGTLPTGKVEGVRRALHGLRPRRASTPIYSTVSNELVDGAGYDAEYWVRSFTEPTQLTLALRTVSCAGSTLFIEISPDTVLLDMLEELPGSEQTSTTVVGSMHSNQNELSTLLASLGVVYTMGYPVNWNHVGEAQAQVVTLPGYPWQMQRYWLETVREFPIPKEEVMQFDSTFDHEYIKTLDPLGADTACRQLREMNERADVHGLIAALQNLLPSPTWFTEHSSMDFLAAMRDLGLFLGSIKRHGVEPITAVPEVESVLLKLGARTDMIPRDTVHHYISWNPEGDRQRTYTNHVQEPLLMNSARISLPQLRFAIDVCQRLYNLEITDPEFGVDVDELTMYLKYMEKGIDNAIKHVTPEFFARIMRPYFEEVIVAGTTYMGPAAAHIPLSLIDLALWASDHGDAVYNDFWHESSQYSLPPWRTLYANWQQGSSMVTRLIEALGSVSSDVVPPPALRASGEALCRALRALVVFRAKHFGIARQAYREEIRLYDHGSGGASLNLLDDVLKLTQKNALLVRNSVGRSHSVKHPV